MTDSSLPTDLALIVNLALQEDIGDGDITSLLIADNLQAKAHILCREEAILCGIAWVEETYRNIDSRLQIQWNFKDGDSLKKDAQVAEIVGNARAILTGERTALNFLQTLSGTATITKQYTERLKGTSVILLDTRKTLPGMRNAQKYAVRVAGGSNHRKGLYDAYLVKENHIQSCGNISNAIATARKINPNKVLEVEVQNLEQLSEAISAKPDIIMLDNFKLQDIRKAVTINPGNAKLEVSGNINQESLVNVAKTGVDYISVGALTKHCRAIDFSLLLV
ncbi:MAG: nicotinate-nucleotide diphosphorylase (carboxylating) [Gammaproteobacteria bacterium]|nr:nicotinate-nucleotide diphosphorylase (carboxylating) [Gammaproteobacteria bacterium]|tara:strand:+ start:1887 stop:2723 length:837 start_codon:yes stop_codon:yes gene_type:complete